MKQVFEFVTKRQMILIVHSFSKLTLNSWYKHKRQETVTKSSWVKILDMLVRNQSEEPLLGLNQSIDGTDRLIIPLQDEARSGNKSLFGSWFSTSVFPNVPGTVPLVYVPVGSREVRLVWTEQPKYRNPADFLGKFFSDHAYNFLRYMGYVFLNDSGSDVFQDWSFLGCSPWVSFARVANFFLFLNVAMLLGVNVE